MKLRLSVLLDAAWTSGDAVVDGDTAAVVTGTWNVKLSGPPANRVNEDPAIGVPSIVALST